MWAVVTDSTSDLPPLQADQLGIHLVPLTLHFKGKNWTDWHDVQPDTVYDYLRVGGEVQTRPVPQKVFEREYSYLLKSHEQIMSLHLSRHLSATLDCARAAARALRAEDRIHIIDTQLVGYPLTDVALIAKRILDRGGDVGEVERAIAQFRHHALLELAVPSLTYLRRTGRINRIQEVAGNMMQLRPILRLDAGQIVVHRRVRAEKTLADMLDHFRATFGDTPVSMVIANAGHDVTQFERMRRAIKASGLKVKEGRIQIMGPAVGVHIGPGAYSLMAVPI